jgi:Cu/Ag efflux protein CusF
MRHKLTVVTILTVLAILLMAGAASAATIRGKVVHKNRSAHSYVVAKKTGQMVTIHAKRSPALGRNVVVRAHLLSNGTYGQRAVHLGGLTHHARIHGVVTYVNARNTKAVLSAKGVSMVVHKRASAKAAARLAVGDVITVTGTLDADGDIDCDSIDDCGTEDGYVELEGHITAIDTDARTLTLSADDEDELPGTISVIIPADWDMNGYAVGDEVEVTATLNADGTFTAVGTSLDGNEHEADDEDCEQGNDCDEVEGIVTAIDTATRTVTLAVDADDAMAGATVTVIFPDTWDMAEISVGDELEVVATQNSDGTYTAVSAELDDEQGENDCID